MDIKPIVVDGAIIDGKIQLDQPIDLANHSRVRVTVNPVLPPDEIERRWDEELRNLERLKKEQPIGSGGLKFTREQLYERD